MTAKTLSCATMVAGAVSAQAFTLAFPYGGGHTSSATGSDSFATVTDPIHVNSASSEAAIAAARLNFLFPTANVAMAGDISGTMSFDTLLAETVSRGGGAQWDARLNTTDSLANTYLAVIQTTVVNGGGPSYSYLFRNISGDASPHFYNAADEAPHRNGSDAFGAFSYRYEDTLLSFITGSSPYTMTKTWSAFLMDDTTAGGQRSFTIHDGVSFATTFGSPAPEPATWLILGLGGLMLLRTKRV